MPKRKPTFADYGRLGGLKGGKSTSDAKAAAARKNGQKGGWPKGKRRKNLRKGDVLAIVIQPAVNTDGSRRADARQSGEFQHGPVSLTIKRPKGSRKGKR